LLPLLAAQPLDWSRVLASPTDERWVAVDAPDSNLQLLRQGLPAARWLDPRQGVEPTAAAQGWTARLGDWLPFSAVLLGMGEDGHFASLFPGMPGLEAALDAGQPVAAVIGRAPVEPRARLSLNLAMLLNTHWLGLLAFGERKGELIEQVLVDAAGTRALPLHALLHQQRLPPEIYWAP
jgi:6-phosphogluconolactonase